MSLTRERIESLAPDQASLSAALKLVKPAAWPLLAVNDDASLLWGECQGSGATPYRVVVSVEDAGYKCTCPSRKFPCKHALAVMWMRVDKPERFAPGEPPTWVDDWLGRRRGGAPRAGRSVAEGGDPQATPSLEAALSQEDAPEKPADPKAAERAEAQRLRLRAAREEAILAGLDELDRWISDQLGQGLAGFQARAAEAVRPISKRLNDAKAGALAARLDRIGPDLYRLPEGLRADAALERLAALTLIAGAYRRQDEIGAELREDVRRAIGWTVKRDELLADERALRVVSTWIVAANLQEVQPDRLRRLETWLINARPEGDAPRAAVLIDFVPVSGGSVGFAYTPGECIDGEIVFYPSAAPVRGLMATRAPAKSDADWPAADDVASAGLASFRAALARLPWLDQWPVMLSDAAVRTVGADMLVLTAADGRVLPVERGQSEALLPLIGLEGLSALCLYDGRTAHVLACDTTLGRWHEA